MNECTSSLYSYIVCNSSGSWNPDVITYPPGRTPDGQRKRGVNINYVKEIAGHSDIKTTMNYIYIVTNDLREAVNKISIEN